MIYWDQEGLPAWVVMATTVGLVPSFHVISFPSIDFFFIFDDDHVVLLGPLVAFFLLPMQQ